VTHTLLHLVERFGYAIVLLGVGIESFGVPLPGETVLVVGAALAAQGHLAAWGVALAAWTGAVVGDNIGYWIGRRYGRRLTKVRGLRRLYSEGRLQTADRFFERLGWLAVFLGRFVALLRIFAGPLAGMHGTPWRVFLLANAAGAAIWVATMTTIGVLVGANLDRAISIVTQVGYWGIAGAAVVLVAALAYRHRIRRLRASRAADAE
jgi:membrane protein DedA with SNARE-associated domain